MLNIAEFMAIMAILVLIWVSFILLVYIARKFSNMYWLLEESLSRKGALKEIGIGIGYSFNQSARGSNKDKAQVDAWTRKIMHRIFPEEKFSWVPEDLREDLYGNFNLIPAAMKFWKTYNEIGLMKATTEAVNDNSDLIGLAGKAAAKIFNKPTEEHEVK